MPRLTTLLAFAALVLPAGGVLAQPLVYVTDPSAGTLTAVDSGTNAITRTPSTFSGPATVAIKSDGTRVYVTESASGKIAVFDGTKIADPNENPLIKEIAVGGLDGSMTFKVTTSGSGGGSGALAPVELLLPAGAGGFALVRRRCHARL